MPRRRFQPLALVALFSWGCSAPPPAPVAAPVASVAPVTAPIPSSPVAAVEPAKSRKLRLEKKEDGTGGSSCTVVDVDSGEVVGRATSSNTAAGGSTIECHDFVAGGKVIRFRNSRGVYAKDASNDHALPCGEGAFANDVKSCVQLDTSPQTFSGTTEADAPYDVRLCLVGKDTCPPLVRIPRGMNRIDGPGGAGPERWWDAMYCSDDRVLVVGEGKLRLFEVPSGRELSSASAPGATRITRCEGGVAETTDGKKTSFVVDRDSVH